MAMARATVGRGTSRRRSQKERASQAGTATGPGDLYLRHQAEPGRSQLPRPRVRTVPRLPQENTAEGAAELGAGLSTPLPRGGAMKGASWDEGEAFAFDSGPYCARCLTARGCRCNRLAYWLWRHTPGIWP